MKMLSVWVALAIGISVSSVAQAYERNLSWLEVRQVFEAIKMGNQYLPSEEWLAIHRSVINGDYTVTDQQRVTGGAMVTKFNLLGLSHYYIDANYIRGVMPVEPNRPGPNEYLEALNLFNRIDLASSLLHELQHARESRDTRIYGGNVGEILAYMRELVFFSTVLRHLGPKPTDPHDASVRSRLYRLVCAQMSSIYEGQYVTLGGALAPPPILNECSRSETGRDDLGDQSDG